MNMTLKRLARWLNQEKVAGYIFVLPFIIGLLAFTIIPVAYSFYLSFTEYDVLSAPQWIGIKNFITMFTQDAKFWKSFGVTFYYTVVSVPLRLVMALLIAMVLYKNTRATGFYRAAYYLPSIIGGSIAVAILWRRMFVADGVFNSILQSLGINSTIAWLGRTDTAIWTLILLAVWQFGSSMLIFLAGLKQIPVSLYEAATVDGAGRARKFFKITLPMLTPVIFFNLVMQMINGFMAFTQSYVITGGKPLDSTLFYTVYMYKQSFEFYNMGYGSAMAWFMLVIVAVMTAIVFKTSDKWVYYESK